MKIGCFEVELPKTGFKVEIRAMDRKRRKNLGNSFGSEKILYLLLPQLN